MNTMRTECALKRAYPKVGRWLNADIYASTGQGIIGCNMYAYCLNNPIAYKDDLGCLPHKNGATTYQHLFDDGMYSSSIVDLTQKLNEFMNQNVEKLQEYKEQNGYINAVTYFVENVVNGGDLDIKLQDEWKFEDGKEYYFRGEPLRFDDPGNINYGYVGASILPQEVLCIGAGLNQIKKYGFKYGNMHTYFDDTRDHIMIRWGYFLYKEEH